MSKFRRIKHSLNIKKAIFSRDFVTFAAKFGDAVPVLPEEYRILFRENKIIMKISKNRYLQGFGIVVLLLALVRVIFPGVAKPKVAAAGAADSTLVAAKDSAASDASSAEISDASADAEGNVAEDLKEDELSVMPDTAQSGKPSIFFDKDGKEVKHRIFSVPHFGNTFPDQQDVQILAATKHGVKPVQNRLEAENSKGKLVYVGSNPFFYVDKLNNSIPYLVPRASVLLQDIGRAYFDSLQIKGIPLHKIIVTSILRTKDDVAKLRTRNGNATENSCHLYGTTFDICYNRYKQIQTREQPRRQVQNDTLKWVFSEVLRDFRNKNRCYIKYEVKQGCFHITVRTDTEKKPHTPRGINKAWITRIFYEMVNRLIYMSAINPCNPCLKKLKFISSFPESSEGQPLRLPAR